MNNEEAIKWIGNLINDIGQTRGMYLWPYAQALQEIITMLSDRNAAQQWISVKDRLPETGKTVLATCEIRSLYGYKKQYVCEAYYAEAHSISEGKYPEDTDCYDYSEEDDEYYLKVNQNG